jgi:hypothetical protein
MEKYILDANLVNDLDPTSKQLSYAVQAGRIPRGIASANRGKM